MVQHRPIVAITTGDPCGIGAEITVRTLCEENIYKNAKPLVISDSRLIQQAIDLAGLFLKVNSIENPEDGVYSYGVIDVLDLKNYHISLQQWGTVTQEGGKASFEYIGKAIQLALEGKVQAVTTGPIHKKAINKAGHHYAGHTEIFADLTGTQKFCMMLSDKHMRVSHVTTHVAMKNVTNLITVERILDVIKLTNEALIKMGITNPKIAVAGFNPHAGEDGLFGDEEEIKIIPAIKAALQAQINVEGPVPPDTVFVKLMGKQYDAVIAMYHDQGHIPMKLAGFHYDNSGKMATMSGVNLTLGLPIIRTSVDHGVAYEIAGKGMANCESMMDAFKLASLMARKF